MGYCSRILLCEHDRDLSERLRQKLEPAGFWVDIAADGIQLQQQLERNQYDAILLNLIFPDQDAVSLIHDLRVTGLSIPILATLIKSANMPEDNVLATHTIADNENDIDWVQKAAQQARLIFAIKAATHRLRRFRPVILHVESDHFCAGLIATSLRDNAEIVHAFDVEEVNRHLNREVFDIAILNPVMPDIQGKLALHSIAGSTAETPIILHTLYEFQDDQPDLYPADTAPGAQSLGLIEAMRTLILHGMPTPVRAQA